jgi:thiamine phosphate synthase YjbQ (UPF0047 family)
MQTTIHTTTDVREGLYDITGLVRAAVSASKIDTGICSVYVRGATAGIVGPSETVPVTGGELALSTWQNIFLCEFDGPRQDREIVISVISSE